MIQLIIKLVLTIFIGLLAYFTLDKSNPKLNKALISLIVISVFSLFAEFIGFFDQEKKKNNFLEMSNELHSAKKIQEAQLSEIKTLKRETEILKNIGNVQLKATFYLQELKHNIHSVNILILLKDTFTFESLHPFFVAYDFSSFTNERLKFRRLIESKQDTKSGGKDGEKYLLSYYNKELSTETGKTFSSGNEGKFLADFNYLLFPVHLPENIGKIVDFQDEKFFIYLSVNLFELTKYIEIIVNGWGIMHAQMLPETWDRVKLSRIVTWNKFEYPDLEVMRSPWVSQDLDIQNYQWRIDLYDSIPPKYEQLESKYNW